MSTLTYLPLPFAFMVSVIPAPAEVFAMSFQLSALSDTWIFAEEGF